MMNSSGLPSVGSDTGTQAIIKQIARDASTSVSGVYGQVPCRTIAYKEYPKRAKEQREFQKGTHKRTPRITIEK